MENKVKEAVETLVEALKTDDGYRISWQANIAMAFKDEYNWSGWHNSEICPTEEDIHVIANKASDNFLKMLCK